MASATLLLSTLLACGVTAGDTLRLPGLPGPLHWKGTPASLAARIGDAIAFHASTDGRSWRLIRVFTLGAVRDLEVGFASQSPTGEVGRAVFTDIRYEARRLRDVLKGE